MSQPYYITTRGLTVEAVRQAVSSAKTQEDKILAYYRLCPPGHAVSASQVHQAVFGWSSPTPLTSTRRALTNLADRGLLEKLPQTIQGAYRKPEHQYRLVDHNGQMKLL